MIFFQRWSNISSLAQSSNPVHQNDQTSVWPASHQAPQGHSPLLASDHHVPPDVSGHPHHHPPPLPAHSAAHLAGLLHCGPGQESKDWSNTKLCLVLVRTHGVIHGDLYIGALFSIHDQVRRKCDSGSWDKLSLFQPSSSSSSQLQSEPGASVKCGDIRWAVRLRVIWDKTEIVQINCNCQLIAQYQLLLQTPLIDYIHNVQTICTY